MNTTPWRTVLAVGAMLAAAGAQAGDFKMKVPDPAQLDSAPCAVLGQSLAELAKRDKDIAAVAEVLQASPKAKDLPFALGTDAKALLLSAQTPQAVMPMGGIVEVLSLLVAVLPAGSGRQAECMITREDGMAIRLYWDPGTNAAPAVGKWEGALNPAAEKTGWTDVALEGTTRDGQPVRLLRTVWVNDNQWYPVSRLTFKLADKQSRFLVLGVSRANRKK
jgi:hypothetical protein